MLLKRNLVETLLIISSSGSLLCIILNYVTNISPITGFWFPVYTVLLFILAFLASFKLLQCLLHLNKPINYDFDALITNYPSLSLIRRLLPKYCFTKKSSARELQTCKEYDTNELSVISSVLERRLVSSWYVSYISQEIGFPFACKQMLDQIIGKTFQIFSRIETKEVYVDLSSIMISHLKEYRKAVKRHEKSDTGTIESHYKKCHTVWESNNCNSAEHCTNVLRIILKELVTWELWDTPHSELLVRILSKKLDNFIDTTLSDPDWLNHRLITVLMNQSQPITSKEDPDLIGTELNTPLNESDPEVQKPIQSTLESALSTVITKTTAPILQRAIVDEICTEPCMDDPSKPQLDEIKGSMPLEISSSPILRQRRGRQGKTDVKIYDRIIEGSVKTWETDMDLQCISLGQDLLASLDGEITLSRLWEQDADGNGSSPNPPRHGSPPQPLWFGEEDSMDMELNECTSPQKKEQSPSKKEQSPKATEVLLKDIQTTVNQAKTKIGDFQDEAAGMMEGLLDFGIAGFKKGLRFTGLHDDKQDNFSSHHKDNKVFAESSFFPPLPPPSPASPLHTNKHTDHGKEYTPSTVIQKDENTPNNNVPQLIKQHRVISQDSVPTIRARAEASAPVMVPLGDSPELEYEETADLSTSIAKLRSLLLQHTADSPPRLSESLCWEGAEETRGRTQHATHANRPVDTATLADEYDMNADRSSPQGSTTNNMQRLDKLFQRTVTGVFNSIRTAVGAEGDEGPEAEVAHAPPHHWTYVCTPVEISVGGAVARLVGSRRAHAHVDAALDSLEHLSVPPPPLEPTADDFDEWCSGEGARWCSTADAAGAALLWRSHVTHRLASVLVADIAEAVICNWLDDTTAWLRSQVFIVFEELAKETEEKLLGKNEKIPLRKFDVEETCAAVMKKLPGPLYLFGEDNLAESVKLVISSFSHKAVNKDVIFRILDLIAVHFKKSAGVRNSFDAN